MTPPLEQHLSRLTDSLQRYTVAVLSQDDDAVQVAASDVRNSAVDFVVEAYDEHGGWPNVFAELLQDEEWFDEAGDEVDELASQVVAVRARYDVAITDEAALLGHVSDAGDQLVERVPDALYELIHRAGTPVDALHDVPGLHVVAGVYVFSTSPAPLTLARMEAAQPVELLAMEDGSTELRSAADFPMFPDRDSAVDHARRSARKVNLEG